MINPWGEDDGQRMLESDRYKKLHEDIKKDREERIKQWIADSVAIHWDAAMWKKTMEHLPMELRKLVIDNKKTSKRYILLDPLIRLGKESIKKGFFIAQMTANSVNEMHSYKISDRGLLTPLNIERIETAVLKTAVQSGYLPRTIKYNDKRLFSDELEESVSATGFGYVYFVRNGDIFKIGITENLVRRFTEIKPDEILNIVRCTNYKDVEKRLHVEYKDDRIPQSEYFRLTEAKVNRIHSLLLELAEK